MSGKERNPQLRVSIMPHILRQGKSWLDVAQDFLMALPPGGLPGTGVGGGGACLGSVPFFPTLTDVLMAGIVTYLAERTQDFVRELLSEGLGSGRDW